jgi:glucose-6-phosphate 1-epimerase
MMPLPTLALESRDGARATIALHGAHVLSWHPAGAPAGDAGDRLFLSARSVFREGTAIRGGVPVIFPQFAERGPLPKHGFARTLVWTPVSDDAAPGRARLRLVDSPDTRALWPHEFAAELTVTVGGAALAMTLAIENRGPAPFDFTAALHGYLRVPDASRAAVLGLTSTRYLDSTDGGRERVEDAERVTFPGEVDRIYVDAPPRIVLHGGDAPLLDVEAAGFPDLVVWNPGAAKGAALVDLEPDGAARFVCLEAAAVATPVTLAPGARWTGTQTLTAHAP